MSNYTYSLGLCPHNYFPDDSTKNVLRVSMLDDAQQLVGWADYIIDDGWTKFITFTVAHQHRAPGVVITFIDEVYKLVDTPKQTFWWNATETMAKYFDQIVALRPDMTFAAGGAIKKIVKATK